MFKRIVAALAGLFAVVTAQAHPGHPALSPQHVHVGGEIDIAWLGLLVVAALFALLGVGRMLVRSATRRRR